MSLLPIQSQAFQLAGAGEIIGSTTLTVASFNDIDGNAIAMADLGTKAYGTLEPNSGIQEEQISFTGVTNNTNGTVTLTGVHNVGFKSPYTETSGLLKSHAGGVKFVLANTSGFYSSFAILVNDDTVTGDWTFSNHAPTIPTEISSAIHRAASIEYVNAIAIAGAPNASTTVKGIVQEATTAQVNAGTATGSTGAVLFPSPADLAASIYGLQLPTSGQKLALVGNNTDIAVGSSNLYMTQTGSQHNAEKYAIDNSGSSTAYTVALTPVPTSLTDGMVIYVKLVNANTTTTPTLSLNSLTAHTIVKGSNIALAVGDIANNMRCTLMYDLANTIWV